MENYTASLTYFERTDKEVLEPHSEQITGSKTRILNEVSDIIKENNFETIVLMLRKGK